MTVGESTRRASTDGAPRPEPDAPVDSDAGGRRAPDDRLARLEAKFDTFLDRDVKNLATKKNIRELKVWILAGVLGGMIAAAGIAIGASSLVSHTPS